MHRIRSLSLALGLSAAAAGALSAQTIDSVALNGFRWRTVGPANFEGRVADVVGIPSPSKTFFVAAAGGGIWKTTNDGTTYRPVFDKYPVVAMGSLAIAPSDTMQVWAGTGEQNSRNTIEPGYGIYKSTDGGLNWKLMGLEKTQHIGRIIVHPTNPNIVYVAALGAAWKANPERGLYKTTDGGATWKLIKFVDDSTGFIDVAFEPGNPSVMYASSYQRLRGPYFLKSGGKGSAMWKSTDGGDTWNKIQGGGWPTTMLGRINMAVSMSSPQVVYASVEADSNPNPKPKAGDKAQKLQSGLYRSADGGKTWEHTNEANTRPFYYNQVRVDPRDPMRVYFSSTPVMVSDDGGKTARTATQGIHVDHHAMWIDPNDPQHFIVGDDGGVSITHDRGGNYTFGAQLPIGQFYEVSYDYAIPYNICGGAQDNGTWCGPSRRKSGPVTNAYWFTYNGGDGFYSAQSPVDPNIIFGESQGGNIGRYNVATGERTNLVKPSWRAKYRQYEDSLIVVRGDTSRPPTKDVSARLTDIRNRMKADSMDYDLRFNWNTPFFLSPHNPNVFYAGGNRVLKSTQLGENLYPISGDLSKHDAKKIDISMNTTGGITNDATGAETYATVVALAESYVRPGLLYAGTDDGNVWQTRNDGATWENLTDKFKGLVPNETYVTRIEPSHFDTATFYIAFDGHRTNDFTPYLLVTNDGGRSFHSIASGLKNSYPSDYLHVIREDPYNRDLLYVGSSAGVQISLDRGHSWQSMMAGLPTVPVFDLKIHPRDRELIAATHGRGFWIVDVAPLEQVTSTVASKPVYLFEPKKAFQYGQGPAMGESSNGAGQKLFSAPSPQYGAEIVYRIAAPVQGPARIVITDARGDTLRSLTGPSTVGVQRVVWDFRGKPAPRAPLSPAGLRDSAERANRSNFVLDSMEKAGTIPKPMTDALRRFVNNPQDALAQFGGGGGGGGRGGFGGAGGFQARPGEGPIVGAGAGGGGGGGGGGGRGAGGANGAAAAGIDLQALQNLLPGGFQEFQTLITPPRLRTRGAGGGGGGGFGAGGATPLVNTGDYLVTLSVGGQTYKQVLRVERISGTDGSTIGFGGDDDDGRDP